MSTDMPFHDKVALITGASRGIGAALAKLLAHNGAHVVLLARTIGGLEAVDDIIRKDGRGRATLMPVDLFNLPAIDSLGPTIATHIGKLDMFIGNAAMLGTLGPYDHIAPDEWQRVIDLNLMANIRLMRSIEPLLKKSPAGRAVFVTSGAAITPKAYWGPYAVSKAGLEAFAKICAAEHANTDVRVNIFDPGRVRTSMRAQAYPGEDPKSRPHPDEIAPHFLPLLSDDCPMNGQRVAI